MSTFSQRLSKFIYNKTKRRLIAGTLFGGLLLKNSLKHVFPDDFFFPFYGFETRDLSLIEASQILKEVRKDAGIKPGCLSIQPFVSRTTEVVSAGFSAFGLDQSQIGIPRSYFCSSIEEISKMDICKSKRVNRFLSSESIVFEKIDENEVRLMESLLLSDDAKRFAIARHLSYIQRNWAIYQAVIPSTFVVIGYFMSLYSPRLLFMKSSNVPLFNILCAVFAGAFISYILCKLTKAALGRKISKQADIDAANISPLYAKGGVEFFSKLSETNKALRVLLGKKGERIYTVDGDIIQGPLKPFSAVGPTFSTRKQYLNKLLLENDGTTTKVPHNI